MTVGTGIFLAALVLGAVALFVATKDRWNWKKVILWPLAILLVMGVLGGGSVYLSSLWPWWPQAETTYWGISLGDSEGDVRFKKGEPAEVTEGMWIYHPLELGYRVRFDDEGQVDGVFSYLSHRQELIELLEKADAAGDVEAMRFQLDRIDAMDPGGNKATRRAALTLVQRKILAIVDERIIRAESPGRPHNIQGVGVGDSLTEFIDRFGEPTSMSSADDHLSRNYKWENSNVWAAFREERALAVGISLRRSDVDPSQLSEEAPTPP